MSDIDRSHLLPEEDHKAFLVSLGRLCAYWATVDRELNFLIGSLLGVDDRQVACIATEINDIAPRCRMIKTLSYTINVPQDWRDCLNELCSTVSNTLAPQRNRFVHDYWVEAQTTMRKIDRRAKVSKPQAFAPPQLMHDTEEYAHVDEVDTLAVRSIYAGGCVATARFDLTHLRDKGNFPAQPQLSVQRVRRIGLIRFPMPSETPEAPPQSTEG